MKGFVTSMPLKLIDKESFHSTGNNLSKNRITNYWDNINFSREKRLEYHLAVIEILKSFQSKLNPSDVLEIGSMGVQVVENSDTLDHPNNRFSYIPRELTYSIDLLETPYQIREYSIIIALRVLHWIDSKEQYIVINELLSHTKTALIIVVPRKTKQHPNGLNYDKLVEIVGFHPSVYIPFAFAPLYFFDLTNKSIINLENVIPMKTTYRKYFSLSLTIKNVLRKLKITRLI